MTAPDIEIIRRRPKKNTATNGRPPLLFVHGAFSGAWCWDVHFLDWYARRGWDCWAFSFRGHGNSGGTGDLHMLGICDYAADLDRVVADMPAPPVLVAHSMGGAVCMRWLSRDGAGAAGLALMATVPPSGLMGPALWLCVTRPMLLAHIGALQAGMTPQGAENALALALFPADAPPELGQAYLPKMSNESVRACMDLYLPWMVPQQARDLPCLVMGAAADNLIPPASVRETAAALGVEAAIVPGVGHGMMLDPEWRAVAGHLTDWLTSRFPGD